MRKIIISILSLTPCSFLGLLHKRIGMEIVVAAGKITGYKTPLAIRGIQGRKG